MTKIEIMGHFLEFDLWDMLDIADYESMKLFQVLFEIEIWDKI